MKSKLWFVFVAVLLCCAVVPGRVQAEEVRSSAAASARIDINRAGVDELSSLKGIGPSLAERIVTFRKQNGPFKKVDELLSIRGIGPKLLEKIKARLTVSSAKTSKG